MTEMGISAIDWAVFLSYLVAMAGIGLYVGLKVKDTEHYFFGSRRFGKWLMIGQSFGVGTHSEMPVAVAGAVYTMGLSGIWYQWKNLFATPFYWIIAPVFRRMRRTTTAELTEDRYGPAMGAIYIIFALGFFTINLASMLKGAAKVIYEAVGGELPVNEIVIGMTVAFILYSFVGGLVASAWTNFFQGFLIIALSFMLLPIGWSVVGGLSGMKASLEGYKFSLATPEGIGPWVIALLTINGLVGVVAQPHMPASVGTGKDERSCRVGFFYGNFVKRFCTVGWAVVGLLVAVMIAQGRFGVNELSDPEHSFGFACRYLLFPGGLGLLVASILAANMSTCSAFMVDSGALFTQGFYRKYVSKEQSDTHYLWVGRMSGLLITLVGVFYAIFLIDQVLYSFLLTETMATYMGISIFTGLIWPRANRWGAIASLVVAMGTNFLLYYLQGQRLDHWDANVFLISLVAGTLALILVSVLTGPEPQAQVEPFFVRLQTSSDGEKFMADWHGYKDLQQSSSSYAAAGSRSAAQIGRQLLFVNLLNPRRATHGFGFFRSYREDLRGFAVGVGLCALMVFGTWLIFQW